MFILSPAYMVQSFHAFFLAPIVMAYWPFLLVLLAIVGLGPPCLTLMFFNGSDKYRLLKDFFACVLSLPLSVLGTFLFSTVLPLTALSLHWLRVDDVIRATNGPAALVFRHLIAPYQVLTLPRFYKDTPQKDVDLVRSHVAAVFLKPDNIPYFVSRQYPDLYEAYEKQRMLFK